MKSYASLLGILWAGCSYGYDTVVMVTPISNTSSAETIHLPQVYFDDPNVKITREYEQLAFMEVKGISYSSADALLLEMKKKAASIGADAIINIRQQYITRERGEAASEILDREKNKPEVYQTISLTGIAIKYK